MHTNRQKYMRNKDFSFLFYHFFPIFAFFSKKTVPLHVAQSCRYKKIRLKGYK